MGDDETILIQNAPLAEDVIAIRPHDQTVTTKSLEETTAVSNLTKNSDPDILLHFILMKKKKQACFWFFDSWEVIVPNYNNKTYYTTTCRVVCLS